jgi:adenylyltransferase/sulfurtransferase
MADSDEASEAARGPSCSVNEIHPGVNGYEALPQITPDEYNILRLQNEPHVLLDVRVPEQFALCSLPNAVNIPLKELPDRIAEVEELSNETKAVYCICRRGKASVSATLLLSELLTQHPKIKAVFNVKGGLDAWRQKVDDSFPRY